MKTTVERNPRSDEGAFLIERGQQHREMRVRGNRELREKIEELNLKLLNQQEDMQKDFEHKVRRG